MSEEQGPEAEVAAGIYAGTCTGEVMFGTSGENQTETVAVELLLPDGQTRVWSPLFFSEKAKPYSIAKLKACGWSGKGLLAEQIKDKPVRFSIRYEPFEGEMKMKVNIFDGNGGFHFKTEMTDSQRSNFMSSLEQEAASPPGAGGKTSYPADWDKTEKKPPGGGFSLNKPQQ